MSKIQNILLLSFGRKLISTTVYLYTDIVCFPLTQLTYKKRFAVVQFEEEAGKELPQHYTYLSMSVNTKEGYNTGLSQFSNLSKTITTSIC